MMLFIGGTRDGQRRYVGFRNGNPILRVPVENDWTYNKRNLSTSLPCEVEIYIEKEVWKRKQHMFSVMVKDGSQELLDAYLAKYNKKTKDKT